METTTSQSLRCLCRRAWATAWLLAVAACGGGGTYTADTTPAANGEATIGAAGGTTTGADGVSVRIPAGALAADTTVRVARDTTGLHAALTQGPPDADKAVVLSPTYALTPHGATFNEPVELRIPIDRAAASGPGLLVALRAQPGQAGWEVLPIQAVENGMAVVATNSFSYYQIVRITQMPGRTAATPTTLPRLEIAMTLGGQQPSTFPLGLNNETYRRLYGVIANRTDSLTLTGRVVGLPATCAQIALSGIAKPTSDATARDVNAATYSNIHQPVFAQITATTGTDTTGGGARPTLEFSHTVNIDNAPFKREVFTALRTANNTGPTPPVGLSFNAWARCSTPVNLGGGIVLTDWALTPGIEQLPPDGTGAVHFNANRWTWATVHFTTDYLPQGFITHPSDVNVAPGQPASFATSAWPVPLGEQRIEWWRSDDNGAAWTRVRTSLVPVANTADTYTLPAAAAADHNALFRARLCTMPRQANVEESCTDGLPARLTVLQGVAAASFSLQPRPLLVRTGQTASFSVVAQGTPAPALRWQSRQANSTAPWSDVATGTGATSANYTTPPLALSDNGLQLRAVASNAAGDVPSVAVTVSVSAQDVAPAITTQPASLAVATGGDAVFAVAASGTEALSYQWRRNGTPIAGATAPVLRLAAVSAGDANGYSVQVSNAQGSVLSNTATLTVTAGAPTVTAPSIVTQPAPVATGSGHTATFAVGVAGTGPFSYQWLKNAQPIAGATAAYYSVAAAAPADAGTYAVQVSNGAGSVTSAEATLSVSPVAQPTAVAILTAPSPQVQLPGGSATFAVAASGTGPITYQWLKDGQAIAGAAGAVLEISGLNAGDAGSYSVTVSNALGALTSAAATLTVVGAPAITTQPVAASAVEGGTATFTVAASGANLRYQWTRNGAAVPGAASSSYTTPVLTVADSGAVYSVVVFNGAGLEMGQGATLTVTAAPQSVHGKLAALYSHACAITASGQVLCWGKGDHGQLGNDRTNHSSTPVLAAGITNAEFVATGYDTSCAIHGGGQLSCWGQRTGSTTPVSMGPGDVSWVAVGQYHACYVRRSGEVWCFGRNDQGQLGDGTQTLSDIPVQVKWANGAALTGAVSVAAAGNSTCATLANGQVWCWGANVASAARLAPVRLRRLNYDGQLFDLTISGHAVAGAAHYCAIDASSAKSVCWGMNFSRQLGEYWVPSVMFTPDSPHDDATPTEQAETGPLQLAGGGGHSCSLDYPSGTGSTLRCWGRTYFGNGAGLETLGPTAGAGLVNHSLYFNAPVHALAAGGNFTCALRSGAVMCWGENTYGQLGNGDNLPRLTPTAVGIDATFWGP